MQGAEVTSQVGYEGVKSYEQATPKEGSPSPTFNVLESVMGGIVT